MTIGFEVQDTNEGFFRYEGQAFLRLNEELDDAIEQKESGYLGPANYRQVLQQLIETEPAFVDAWAHLAYAFLEENKPKKALEAAQSGLETARKVIPEGFSGVIPWIGLDNRPYLRALHGSVLAQLRLRKYKNAVAEMETMRAINPTDNTGIRFLLGSAYLFSGQIELARTIFREETDAYPIYHYDYALSYLIEEDWEPAVTELRLGFVRNPYVAEILLGNSMIAAYVMHHDNNFEAPEAAVDHVATMGGLWRRHAPAMAFLRWLYHQPKILAERAAVWAPREQLFWERDETRRKAWIAAYQDAMSQIDEKLSQALIAKRTDPSGEEIYPWTIA